MGVSVDTGGKGGKRPLDAELNLVPFIDLLVCCICFLLITAVWTQMARIEVNQKGRGTMTEKKQDVPEPEIKITVVVEDGGYTLIAGGNRVPIDKRGEVYDVQTLGKHLRDLKVEYRDKNDITVAVADDVPYRHIVDVMDVALKQYFTNLRLADATAETM
jgi:biopolymer transport protein TolR